MLSANFASAFGIGVTGKYSTIKTNAVVTDAAGDNFITGSFQGTANFNPNGFAASITTNGTQDTFVAKYGPTGSLLWVKTFAGQPTTVSGLTTTATSQGSGIAVDASGNVFVTGGYSGTVVFSKASGTTTITSAMVTTQVYLAKLDPSGNLLWVDAVAGTTYDTDEAYALGLDGSGGAIIAGSFSDSATFGPTTLKATGSTDAFVARVNSSGSFLWAVDSQGSNGSNAEIHGLAVDPSGNVDLSGFFSGTVDFDPTASRTSLVSAGSDDAVIWKLTSSGTFVWVRGYGSADYDASTAIAVDPSGNIYATGAFSDTVNFGTSSKPDSLTAGPVFDVFVLKLDPNGNEIWVKGLVGPGGWSKGQGLVVDPSGNIDIAGTFQGLIDFDPGSGTDNLTSQGYTDVFVSGLNASGGFVDALQAGETNFNAALGISVNTSGTLALTGTYSGSIKFGSINVPAIGIASVFLATIQVPPASAGSPSVPILEASSDTGLSQSDGITSDTSPIFDVNTAGASDTVELLRNGVIVGQRVGPGAILDAGPVPQGTYIYTAIQVSPAGITSLPSGGASVTILTTPPNPLAAPVLNPADDSGTVGDDITNVRQPRLTVVGKGGTTLQILSATGVILSSIYAAVDGTYTLIPSSPLADGVYLISGRAVDVAGNVGAAGPSLTLTILGTPPPMPSIPSLLASDVSGPTGGTLTNVRQPHIIGTAEVGTTAQVVNSSGIIIATATVAANGTYSARVSSPLPDGVYAVTVVAVDVAGNISAASAGLTFTIDSTPPPMPSRPALLASDVSGPVGGTLTNVREPHITGTAQAGTTVQVINSLGVMIATATVASNGTYSALISSPLSDGIYAVTVVAVDVAGNISPASAALTFTIDGTPPLAPSLLTLLAADDSGTLGDDITNVRQPRLSGTTEAGATVQILDASGKIYGSTAAGANGSFIIKVTAPLSDGAYLLEARAIDLAGNVGPTGPALSLTILGTPPVAPSAPGLYSADDTGSPGFTNIRQPRISGSAPSNTSVQIIGATGIVYATVSSGSTGSYLVKSPSNLADGVYVLHAVATDVAGNISPAGPSFTLTVLTVPPATPSAPTLLAQDDSGTVGDDITNVRLPHLIGSGPAGLTVRLLNASNLTIGSSAVASNGSIVIQPTSPLADGTYVLRLVAVDQAGNVSSPSGSITLVILGTPPPAPSIPSLLALDDTGVLGDGMTSVRRPRLIGTGVPGGRIDWIGTNGLVLVSTTITALNGSFQLQPPTALVNGVYPVSFRETDVAGNVSPTSAVFNLTIRVAAGDDFGDGKSDLSVYGLNPPTYAVQKPTTGTLYSRPFGIAGDVPINGDFFGNGHNDIGIYRPSTSTFIVSDPVTGASRVVQFGQAGDVPIPADYDGDGVTDFAVFRPSTNTFLIMMSATNTVTVKTFAMPGDIPVPADYLGNGHADLAVYRPSTATFYMTDLATGAYKVVTVGAPNGIPIPADYEGLGHADFAVFQPATSNFIILRSNGSTYVKTFAMPGDIPVPADYFGYGRADLAVFRPSTSTFYITDIVTGAYRVAQWGPPGQVKPGLAPITSWFSFAGYPKPNAVIFSPKSTVSAGLLPELPVETPLSTEIEVSTEGGIEPELPTPGSQAFASLSLESWRP